MDQQPLRKTGKPSHQDSGWCVWVKQSNSVTKSFNGLVSGFLLLAVACSDHALEFSLVTVFVFMSICFIALIIVHCYNSEVNILGRISAAQPHRLPFLYVYYVSMHCVYLPTLMLLCSHGDLYTSKIW